jgi:hypothetical protein
MNEPSRYNCVASVWRWKTESSFFLLLASEWVFFFFCGAGVWIQSLHLEPLYQPFFVKGFWDSVSRTICLCWLWAVILLIFASWVALITAVNHHTQPQCGFNHHLEIENCKELSDNRDGLLIQRSLDYNCACSYITVVKHSTDTSSLSVTWPENKVLFPFSPT